MEFVLSEFNHSFTLTEKGVLNKKDISVPICDADAVFYVSLSDMRSVFQFQTDSLDVTNVDTTDLKYYTFLQNWPANLRLNPVNAMMDDSTYSLNAKGLAQNIPSEKMLVKHDFTRYIAENLFNTIHGVDLFANELTLLENMSYLGGDVDISGVYKSIYTSLESIKSIDNPHSSPELSIDGSGNLYMSNATKTPNNIVRELMMQIAQRQPERFKTIMNTDGYQPVPLIEGDVINFTLELNAATEQELITSLPTSIPPRSYLIQWVFTNEPSNTEVIDSAFVGDYPYSPFTVSQVNHDDQYVIMMGTYPSSPPPTLNYMGGWYYQSSGSDRIEWNIPVGTSYIFSDLKTVYATIQVASITSLPQIIVKTFDPDTYQESNMTFQATAGQIELNGNYDCQFIFDLNGNNNHENEIIDGYQQINMTSTDTVPPSINNISSITILTQSTANSNEIEMVVTTVAVVASPTDKKVAYLVPV